MSQPQQREIARSERGEVDPQGRRVAREAEKKGGEGGKQGKVPPENQPGHHPDREQDKPATG
jgi:hypothetical protein